MKISNRQQDEPQTDLPDGLSAPARRALTAAGYTTLEHLTSVSEEEIRNMHGIGPKAIELLRAALTERGMTFLGED